MAHKYCHRTQMECKLMNELDKWHHHGMVTANTTTFSSSCFLSGLSDATLMVSKRSHQYTLLLAEGMLQDVNSFISVVQQTSKEHNAAYKKKNETYRTTHNNCKKACKNVTKCYDYQVALGSHYITQTNEYMKFTAEQGGGNILWNARTPQDKSYFVGSDALYAALINTINTSPHTKRAANKELTTPDRESNNEEKMNTNSDSDRVSEDLHDHNKIFTIDTPTTTPQKISATDTASASPANNQNQGVDIIDSLPTKNVSDMNNINQSTYSRFSLRNIRNSITSSMGTATTTDDDNRDSSNALLHKLSSVAGQLAVTVTSNMNTIPSGLSTNIHASVTSNDASTVSNASYTSNYANIPGCMRSTTTNTNPYSDFWLAIELYRECVVHHTESLQDIIDYTRDTSLHHHIRDIVSRTTFVFIASMKLLTYGQCRQWEYCADKIENICDDTLILAADLVNKQQLSNQDVDVAKEHTVGSVVSNTTSNVGVQQLVDYYDIEEDNSSILKPVTSTLPATNTLMYNTTVNNQDLIHTDETSIDNAIARPTSPYSFEVDSTIALPKKPLTATSVDIWIADALGLDSMPASRAIALHGLMHVANSFFLLSSVHDMKQLGDSWKLYHVVVTVDGYIHLFHINKKHQVILPPAVTYDTHVRHPYLHYIYA